MPSASDTAIDDDAQIMIASFAQIDEMLGPDAFIVRGGTPLGDIVFGEGPARGFSASDVRRLATRFALITASKQVSEYSTVKQFVTDTARAQAAMIITVE